MTTRTDIINRALAAISAQADIVNSAEHSKEAVAARLLYDPTRQQLLRSAHWNFARKTATLSLLKSAPGTPEYATGGGGGGDSSVPIAWSPALPAPPWLYEYLVPADCQQIRFVLSQLPPGGASLAGVAQKFVLASDANAQGQQVNVVLTNLPQAIAVYTMDVVNESLWDSAFQEAMVFGLASRFAMTIAGDKTLARMVAQQAMAAVGAARASDGNEGLTSQQSMPDWISVRGVSADWIGGCGAGPYGAGWITPGFLQP